MKRSLIKYLTQGIVYNEDILMTFDKVILHSQNE